MTKPDNTVLLLGGGLILAGYLAGKKRSVPTPSAAPTGFALPQGDPGRVTFTEEGPVYSQTRAAPRGSSEASYSIRRTGGNTRILSSGGLPAASSFEGIGADSRAPITRTTYRMRCRAVGVKASQPKTAIFDKGNWQGNLIARGFPNVTVNSIKLVGFENVNTSIMQDEPTSDTVLDITFTADTVPQGVDGLGADGGFLDAILDAFRAIGVAITAAISFVIEGIERILVTPLKAVAGFGLLAVGAVAFLIWIAGKSRVRTSTVAFGD